MAMEELDEPKWWKSIFPRFVLNYWLIYALADFTFNVAVRYLRASGPSQDLIDTVHVP